MAEVITRVFMNGNSQAVRIPQEFRLAAKQVHISKNDQGDLVIRALPLKRGTALREAFKQMDRTVLDDWAAQMEANRRTPDPEQEREPF